MICQKVPKVGFMQENVLFLEFSKKNEWMACSEKLHQYFTTTVSGHSILSISHDNKE